MIANAVIEQFRVFIKAQGFDPPENIEPGKFARFGTNGKRGDSAGWALLFPDCEGGIIGDWRTSSEQVWQAKRDRQFTPEEKRAWFAKIEQQKREAKAQREREENEAAQRARTIWIEAKAATSVHAYLKSKKIPPLGFKVYRGGLIINGMNCDGALIMRFRNSVGNIRCLEFIGTDGEKRFLPGASYKAAYFALGEPGPVVAICEGAATALSIHTATHHPVRAAGTAGNLLAVAKAMRERLPNAKLIICADDDYRTEGNPGLTKATEAARVVGGLVAVPDFGAERPEDAKDFNDLMRLKGAESVRASIDNAKPPVLETERSLPTSDPGGLPLETVGKLLSELPVKRDWLIEDLFIAGGISVLAARPKAGKSTFSRDMAACVARGNQFLGKNTKRGPVILLDLEGKREELTESLRGLGVEHDDEIHILCGIAPQDAIELLRRDAMWLKPSLIVVDTLQRLARVRDLNDYAATTTALEPFISIARDSGAHIMLLHHSGRADGHGVDAPMGSTAISGSVDTVAVLKRKEDGARTISTVQRYGQDLEPTLLTMDKDGHVHLGGTVLEAETRSAAARVIEFVRDNPKSTQQDIKEGIEGRWSIVRGAITAMFKDGRLIREGLGKKGEPHLYSVSGNAENAGILVPGIYREPAEPEKPAFPTQLREPGDDGEEFGAEI